MIDTLQHQTLQARSLWSETIRKRFRRLELTDRPAADAVSESLAVFCQAHYQMNERSLSLLMARSFYAAGDVEAADRILSSDESCSACAASWLNVLSGEYLFPELFPLFSSRALYPLHLHVAFDGTAWVLDFDRVLLTDADRHELILFQTLHMLLEKVSNVWKRSNGSGTLGVKGLRRVLRRQTPHRPKDAAQFLTYMQDVLSQQAATARWASVPSVLLLDF